MVNAASLPKPKRTARTNVDKPNLLPWGEGGDRHGGRPLPMNKMPGDDAKRKKRHEKKRVKKGTANFRESK